VESTPDELPGLMVNTMDSKTHSRAFRKMLQLTLTVLAFGSSTNATAETVEGVLGETKCYRGERNREDTFSACRIAWEFSSQTSRNTFWVERLELDEEEYGWITISGPHDDNPGALPVVAEGGYLYRVASCSQGARERTEDCVISTAIWAPVLYENLESIPEKVELRDGSQVFVNHTASSEEVWPELQTIEYNLALISRLTSFVKIDDLPQLTQLSFESIHSLPYGVSKWDVHMDFNIRVFYPKDAIDPYSH
jgi:hypothetical protein